MLGAIRSAKVRKSEKKPHGEQGLLGFRCSGERTDNGITEFQRSQSKALCISDWRSWTQDMLQILPNSLPASLDESRDDYNC